MTRPLSASQVNSFRRCVRAWALDKINRVPREERKGRTELGTRVHEVAENWLSKAEPPDLSEEFSWPAMRYGQPTGNTITRHPGRILRDGFHLLPTPGTPGLVTEDDVLFRTPSSVWRGFADVHYPGENGIPVVMDHKTSVNPKKYGLNEDPESDKYIGRDPQAIIYALWAYLKYDKPPAVRVEWVYYKTDPKANGTHDTYKVGLTVLPNDPIVQETYEVIEETAKLIHRTHASGLMAEQLPGNTTACDAFGGCQYRGKQCILTPAEEMAGALFDEPTQARREMMKELQEILDNPKLQASAPNTGVVALPPIPQTVAAPPPIPSPVAPPPIPQTVAAPPVPQATSGDAMTMILAGERDVGKICITTGLKVHEVQALIRQTDPVNPPEAPEAGGEGPIMPAPEAPVVGRPDMSIDPKDRAQRKALKAYAVSKGLVPTGSRLGGSKLMTLILESEKSADPAAPPVVPAAPPVVPAAPPTADGNKLSPELRAAYAQLADAAKLFHVATERFMSALETM